jgi:cardiolipin synthase
VNDRTSQHKNPRHRFPWREGNHVELLVDGETFFPSMLEDIGRAKHYVWLEMYLVESGRIADRFIDAMLEAVKRGVEVRLVVDHWGSWYLHRHDREKLRAGGVQLRDYNRLRFRNLFSNLARDHRKLLVVDGAIAYAGGAGITDQFVDTGGPKRPWRETMVRIQGPVLQDWEELFVEVWNHSGAPDLKAPRSSTAAWIEGMPGRVTVAGGRRLQGVMSSLIRHIRTAERFVWVSTAYFVPTWRFRRALRGAARRGVDVRVLVAGPHSDHPAVRYAGRRYYTHLLRAGVRIFEYQPRFLHSKAAICDGWCSVGSSNFDRWDLRWNLEANQVVDDQRFAGEIVAMFKQDFQDSVEITLQEWLKRSRSMRRREWFWGLVDVWLHRLGRGRSGPTD